MAERYSSSSRAPLRSREGGRGSGNGRQYNRATRSKRKVKPTHAELIDELAPVVDDWQLLMIFLGVEKHKNDKVELKRDKIVLQKYEAFDLWLRQKRDPCWRDIIDALFKLGYNYLARNLTKKYTDWEDPRVDVKSKLLCVDSSVSMLIKFKENSNGCFDYYRLEAKPLLQQSTKLLAESAQDFHSRIEKTEPYNLSQFFKRIEASDFKEDFKVGVEARFGEMYWKLNPTEMADKLGEQFTKEEWCKSGINHGHTRFNPGVEANHLEALLKLKSLKPFKILGTDKTEETRQTIKFTVYGNREGEYRAVVSVTPQKVFYLDAVYQEPPPGKNARLDIALPGRKYDLRISDCSECSVKENENSYPFLIARDIVTSLHMDSEGKLSMILRGETERNESTWKVKYLRHRVQTQYEWRPDKKWILVRYNVNAFDPKTNQTVKVDEAPINKIVPIPEFDYSRTEVELWGIKMFPKDVSKTHPSQAKCAYMQSSGGVRMAGKTPEEPCDWTAKDVMHDFEEFLKDAFTIAHCLDGSPPKDEDEA